jgi:hypothetical protein
VVALGLRSSGHSSSSTSRSSSFSLGSTTLTGGLGFLRLSTSFSFVGFDLGLDALLGLLVLELLLSLLGSFLDLLLAGQLLLGFVTLLGRLLANLL